MLSRADTDLVRRDAHLPALAEILDPAKFACTMQSAWPNLNVRGATIQYFRYKPCTSCLMGYRLNVGDDCLDVTATAFPHSAIAKTKKALERPQIVTRYGPARFVAPERGLLISLFPADDKLPALIPLANECDRAHLLRHVLANHPELWAAQFETVRYKPERRFVGRLSIADKSQAVVKTFATSGFKPAKNNARAFRSTPEVRCPKRLGRSNHHRIVVSEWMPGRLLFDDMANSRITRGQWEHIGAGLASLHAQVPATPMIRRSRSEEATPLKSLADWIGFVQPSLACESRRVAELLAAKILELPVADQPLHGDFYSKQVLLDGETVSIIDFDESFLGDPAHDVGLFMAHLERDALRALAKDVDFMRDNILCGYERFTGHTLRMVDLYTAIGLIRLLPHPFRNREPDWTDRTAALLERASDLLSLHTLATRQQVVRP